MIKPLASHNLSAVAVAAFLVTSATSHAQIAGFGPSPAAAKLQEEAAAKPTPRTADGKPDLTGYWQTPMAAAGGGPFNAKPKVSEDGKAVALALPAVGVVNKMDISNAAARANNTALRPQYKSPEHQAKAKSNFDRGDLDDPSYGCHPPGVPRIGKPAEIVQTKDALYLMYEHQNRYRVIPTDGRQHDPHAEGMPNGDSVGRWEGDTLVIETVSLDPNTWLDKDGSFHSEDMRVIERFTRKGDTLIMQTTVEDPIFVKPFEVPDGPLSASGTLVAGKPGQHVEEDYPCEERSLNHMQSGEKH
jgi:hypothetical protein